MSKQASFPKKCVPLQMKAGRARQTKGHNPRVALAGKDRNSKHPFQDNKARSNMINEIKNKIHTLVQKYEQGKEVYRTSRFNETQVRNEFLDPLFEILGWDIRNIAGKNTNEREVLLEEPLKANAASHTKKPDYTFRLFGERKFFLEAKKPCVHIDRKDNIWK